MDLPPHPPLGDLRELHRLQSGVVCRTQALAWGWSDNDIRRAVRRREWVPLLPGVYVDHTGPPTWLQRAWAAVLYAWPAALCHGSALRADDGPGRRGADQVLHVAIDRHRVIRSRPGLVIHRMTDLAAKTRWNRTPPTVRIEEAAIDVAAAAGSDLDAIAVLADAVRSRRTTARQLRAALAGRARIARRPFLSAVLDDVAEGVCSALEEEYLTRVERAHGLPTGGRQVHESAKGTLYRDVDYRAYQLLVELDGRLFHERIGDHDRDPGRDLAAAPDGRSTVRVGWGQAHQRPCQTAAEIARLLQARGWSGRPRRCGACDGLDAFVRPSVDDCRPPRSA